MIEPDLTLEELAEVKKRQPKTRGECKDGPRPCRWVSCRYNLFLDVSQGDSRLTQNFERIEDMPESCALDVADRGPQTLNECGKYLNVTRERIRQNEMEALKRLGKRRANVEFTTR